MDPSLYLPALIAGPVVLIVDRLLTRWVNRRRDDAQTGLTVDQRWQAWADELKEEVDELRNRVGKLEDELTVERNRRRGLEAEVDRYKRIAKSLARHVLRLRDELAKANAGELPAIPADVEDAMTIIDLP